MRHIYLPSRLPLLFFICLVLPTLAFAQGRDTLLIDFGPEASPRPWNNVTDATGGAISDLLNKKGNLTNYGLAVSDPFNGNNTSGTQTPAMSLGLPPSATGDSFYGNVAEFAGQVQPTGAVDLLRLRPEKEYTLTIFASRTATDNRQAAYVISGAQKDTVYLNASDNSDRVVTVRATPGADSIINLLAMPGPDNDNASGFYYLGALVLTYDEEEPPAPTTVDSDTLLIDFGTDLSPFPWNNLIDAASGRLDSLVTATGAVSGVGIAVVDSFNAVNTSGSRSPDPAIRFPATATGDSFFGNVTPFNGQVQASGAVELFGLDTARSYEITIFASRTATDNREARYVISGAFTDTLLLNAASNTDRVAVSTGIPAADGTIRITAETGPNNDNGSGFYYLGALRIGYSTKAVAANLDTVLVDFGGSNTSPAPWNNITDPREGTIADLTNSSGFQTGYGLAIFDAFNNINTDGTVNSDPDLNFPPEATGDSFFGNVAVFGGREEPTAGLELTGLTVGKLYTVDLFASRSASDNRETRYIIEGSTTDTVYLNIASNTSELASASLIPTDEGSIRVYIAPGPNNDNSSKFYYLGALRLTYADEAPAGGRSLSLLRPTGGERYQVGKTASITWQSRNLQQIVLEYSTDDGYSYTIIDTVPALPQEYEWLVPDVPTTEARVRISADTLTDVSNSAFTITTDTTTCTIVVLGSSTAEGTGASTPDSAWVNRLANSLSKDTRYEVINLARGGYTTYHILPTGSTPPAGVSINPDPTRNITRALALDPFVIIVNMPSNDAANNFPVADQLRNFATLATLARQQGTRIYIATTQPRNFSNDSQIELQREVRDSILATYGDRAIDFWNGIAADNGFIRDSLDSGDGIHLNDAGHRILFERVAALRLDTSSCDTIINDLKVVRSELLGVKLYPNPVTAGWVNVELPPGLTGRLNIEIVDVLGRSVYRRHTLLSGESNATISLSPSGLPRGGRLYYCVISHVADGEVHTRTVPLLWE